MRRATLCRKKIAISAALLRINLYFAMLEDGIGYAQNRILCHFWSHKAHIAHIGTQPVCACVCVFVCFALRFRKQPALARAIIIAERPTLHVSRASPP